VEEGALELDEDEARPGRDDAGGLDRDEIGSEPERLRLCLTLLDDEPARIECSEKRWVRMEHGFAGDDRDEGALVIRSRNRNRYRYDSRRHRRRNCSRSGVGCCS
jgi:hypothetical protein